MNQSLHGFPSNLWQPFKRIFDTRFGKSLQKEVHLRVFISNFDVLLLHQSESQKRKENEFMSFEKSSHDPLTDIISNRSDQLFNSGFILHSHFGDSLSEENVERIQRILVHVIHNIKSNNEEIQHSTFSSNTSIDFSLSVDFNFSLSGILRLDFNFLRSLLSNIKLVNKLLVLQNSCRVSFGQSLKQLFLKSVHGHLEIIQLFDQFLFGVFELSLFVVYD